MQTVNEICEAMAEDTLTVLNSDPRNRFKGFALEDDEELRARLVEKYQERMQEIEEEEG